MKYGIFFLLIAVVLAVIAVSRGGPAMLLLWPSASFMIVALGYLSLGPNVFGKSSAGLIEPICLPSMLPYLAFISFVWHVIRIVKREPAYNRLTDNIFIGRRLLSYELPEEIDHVVDLTCEFNEPYLLRIGSYYSFQLLDGAATSPEQLWQWVKQVRKLHGNVYIHCAEGHGRTGLFAAALLLSNGHSKNPEDALRFIKSKRPLVRLNTSQMEALVSYHSADFAANDQYSDIPINVNDHWTPSTASFSVTDFKHRFLFVHFWAIWNHHDRTMDKNISQVIPYFEGRIAFRSIDIDRPEFLGICLDAELSNVPTIAFYVSGRLTGKQVGVIRPNMLIRVIEKWFDSEDSEHH